MTEGEIEHVFVVNGKQLFVFEDAYDQEGAEGTIEYHGCRLICGLPMPRRPSAMSQHNENFCQPGEWLGVIECDAIGNLLGFDSSNQVQLDLRNVDLDEMFSS